MTKRPKLACRACPGTVVQEPAPPRLIEGGIPTEALVAQVVVSRFADHQPLYRQAQMMAREGVVIERSTLSFWIGYAAAEVAPVVERLREMLLASSRIFADDQRIQVARQRSDVDRHAGKYGTVRAFRQPEDNGSSLFGRYQHRAQAELPPVQASEQQAQLRGAQNHAPLRTGGQVNAPASRRLVIRHSPAIPDQQFQPIRPFGAEDEHVAGEGIRCKRLRYQRSQLFHALAEVDRLGRHHDPQTRSRRHAEDHAPRLTWTRTNRSAAVSTGPEKRTQDRHPQSREFQACRCRAEGSAGLRSQVRRDPRSAPVATARTSRPGRRP